MRTQPPLRFERSSRLRAARFLALLLGLALAAASAQAAGSPSETERDEAERWVPSIAVFFDALGQKGSGSVTSGPVLGPPFGGPNGNWDAELDAVHDGDGCLQTFGDLGNRMTTRTGLQCETFRVPANKLMGDSSSSDTSVAPLVGGSLELMTPSPFDGYLRPRLFVHGDAAAAFGFERNLAGQESPGEFDFPQGLRFEADRTQQDVEELAIAGQGSRTRMQVRRLVLSAGTGIALTFDVFGRRARIKPSFEYLHFEMDQLGAVHRAVKLRQPSQTNDLSGFRLVSLTHEQKDTYDGIGPGLEIEIDASRLGPIVTSVVLMGRGYHLFGDLKVSFTETNEFGESASWTVEPENWVWRAGVGLRFRWLPE